MPATVIRLAPRGPVPHRRPPLMTPEERDRALHEELRRARVRIARLEAALTRAALEPVERGCRPRLAGLEEALACALEEARKQRERAHAAERMVAALAEGARPVG